MYYLVEYERLNSPDHAYFEIRGTPELGIDSQPVFDGFCRVVDGVLIFAHGIFETVDEALEALEAIELTAPIVKYIADKTEKT